MTDEVAIRAEGLGKKYLIGHEIDRYSTLRDVMARAAKNAWRKTADMVRGREIIAGDTVEEYWALRNANFEVKRGEVLGIIGHNGAGKSTLLKILSRITEPTEGRVTINGRVASLLEVGTGFHGELTGRENVFLNGAILGMTHAEIKRKFDEIVAFSEVERFLDTPVKRYSSGMYLRLAFAVAAHLEPEILIIDEVLAVGDLQFQRKCLGKMRSVASEGRTVLFVSHTMALVANLCERALLLEQGRIVHSGPTTEIITVFLQTASGRSGHAKLAGNSQCAGSEYVSLLEARIISGGNLVSDTKMDEDVTLQFTFEIRGASGEYSSMIHLYDKEGTLVLSSTTYARPYEPGSYGHEYTLPANFLNDGMYTFSIMLLKDLMHVEAAAERCISFVVHETGIGREQYGGKMKGCVRPHLLTREFLTTGEGLAPESFHRGAAHQ